MIAIRKPSSSQLSPEHQQQFLALLPAIQTDARIAFRHLDVDARAEAVAEVVANAYCAFARLVELGKIDLAYGSALARYGIAQAIDGRKVGGRLNVRDVSPAYCQRRKGLTMVRLDHFDGEKNAWREVLVEDRHATPADVVATRIDFREWLQTLPVRVRRIARCLATGETTGNTAKRFGLSPARISQLRCELKASWETFQRQLTDRLTMA